MSTDSFQCLSTGVLKIEIVCLKEHTQRQKPTASGKTASSRENANSFIFFFLVKTEGNDTILKN